VSDTYLCFTDSLVELTSHMLRPPSRRGTCLSVDHATLMLLQLIGIDRQLHKVHSKVPQELAETFLCVRALVEEKAKLMPLHSL
jgi:hypothetical protein